MLSHVALLITDVSEELSSSFFRVSRIVELGTKLSVTGQDAQSIPEPVCTILRKEYS
jgi:hypothetical protein